MGRPCEKNGRRKTGNESTYPANAVKGRREVDTVIAMSHYAHRD